MKYLSVILLIVSCTVVLGVSIAGFQSWPAAQVALAAIANFAFEQWHMNQLTRTNDQDKKISDLTHDIDILRAVVQTMIDANHDIVKQADEVKKIVQQHNLKQMFGPKV